MGGQDTLVYEETDPGYLLGVSLSGSGRYVFLRSWNDVTGEVRLVDAAAAEAPPRLVEPRRVGHMYTLEHWNDRFVVLTNADGAADFKLMTAPLATPERAHWNEWAPEVPGRTIISMKAFANAFVRVDRVEGNSVLVVAGSNGVWREPVRFAEEAYVVRLQSSDYESDRLDYSYESPVTPPGWQSLDLRRPFSPRYTAAKSPYVVERLHARAGDGAEIPITVLRRADTPLDGAAPLMLTGYGAYGYSYETGYAPENLALVDRGWVWAVAHVRGGSEKGAAWFEPPAPLKRESELHRLHRLRRAPDRGGPHAQRQDRRFRLVRRRPAGRGGAQPATGPLRRRHRPRALRRHAEHHERCDPPARAADPAGVGRSAGRPRRLRQHRQLQPLTTTSLRQALSAGAGDHRRRRRPGRLLGAGQVDRQAAGPLDQRRADVAAHRAGRRSCRRR